LYPEYFDLESYVCASDGGRRPAGFARAAGFFSFNLWDVSDMMSDTL
jgi:hypothetical protein